MRTAEAVVTAVLGGERRALARLLTWIEAGDARAREAAVAFGESGGSAHVVGITGAPGSGKSTLTNRIVERLRIAGESVGVLAIDPSSPLTGGALLGDRIRMAEHVQDRGVYIRSVATRGQLGGLALGIASAVRAMDAFGFDWLIVETVGVGQVEVDVIGQTDTTLVVVNPGSGDHVQASKAGLLEIADILVVNKADRPGAAETAAELAIARDLGSAHTWRPPIQQCVAETGEGVAEVLGAVNAHRDHARSTGELVERRRQRRLHQLHVAIRECMTRQAESVLAMEGLADLIGDVSAGRVDPVVAAESIIEPNLASTYGPRR